MDRKAELERKKARLEEMRAAKKNRALESGGKAQTVTPIVKDIRTETDEILENLGIPLADTTNLKRPTPDQNDNEPITHTITKSDAKSTLSMSKVTQTSLPAKEMVQYSKETQTAELYVPSDPEKTTAVKPVDYYALTFVDSDDDSEAENKAPPVEKPIVVEEKALVEEKPVIKEMSEEESRTIMASEDFQGFFCKASTIIERALNENIDLCIDYLGLDDEDIDRQVGEGEQLKLNRTFEFDKWTKNRTVTSLDWSTEFPELLCASYNNNEDMPLEPDGVVLVWNLRFKKQSPEFIFHYQSPVTSACYAKFHPNLIIGGTYSGHIVLWDNRSNKRTPVKRTPISASVHTHPVYCLDMVGSKNAHNLTSISTDGKMCVWSLDMLSQPQESIELQQVHSKTVAPITFSFQASDSNNFVVGTEEGTTYTACRHGNKTGLLDSFEGHFGPVTGVDCHSTQAQSTDYSSYFLSSSFDWTIKLWNNKEKTPVYSFENNSEYIYDVRWSPTHPSLFASVDGSGKLDMWNLNLETEAPAASTVVGTGGVAVNKCRWHQTGSHIALGDDIGLIHVYDLAESLSCPRNDDWPKFGQVLNQLRQDQTEEIEQ